ncbi:hypothetical protein [Psychrobacter sp. AOP7-B1-24]|uniref:hypothetical protein n=1 Tax=Psychrobacter sp. AOP7-B1-24 TaxID=3457645 RepID=UPI00402B7879
MFNKTKLVLATSIIVLGFSSPSYAATTKYGITVSECNFDYDEEKFCIDSRLKSYAKVLKERKPNFDSDKIIYIFETNEPGFVGEKPYRLVVIDTTKKTVHPLEYALSPASDSYGKPVVINNKGETIEFDFNVKSDRFCFSGNIGAYRNSYDYQDGPFCFKYNKNTQGLARVN